MLRPSSLAWAVLAAHLATRVGAACSRNLLVQVTDRYVAAQSTGNLRWLRGLWAANATYLENGHATRLANSTLARPLRVDRSHSVYDTVQCAAFTDLIATDPAAPYVIGAQIWVDGSGRFPTTASVGPGALGGARVTKIDRIVTTTGDWAFNATGALFYALGEDWGEIPPERRDSRAAIQAAADAYLDVFKSADVPVPWGTPCDRLEGGAYTGNGSLTDSCDLGVIQSYDMPNRRYVIDETVGVASVLLEFGSIDNAPDSHEFRVEGGRLRYVHTMTYCAVKPNCGFTLPGGLGSRRVRAGRVPPRHYRARH